MEGGEDEEKEEKHDCCGMILTALGIDHPVSDVEDVEINNPT